MKIQTCLTDPPSPKCHTRCMDMSRMTRLVVPRHAGLDLLKVDVLAVHDHLAEDALKPIILRDFTIIQTIISQKYYIETLFKSYWCLTATV
jgi:hypothetical protein